MSRISYIPEHPTEVIEDESVKAIIYCSDTIDGRPKAAAFSGRRNNPDFYNVFKDEDHRSRHIANYLERLRAARKGKEEAAQRRKDFEHDFEVGDILYSTWGYDQTNVDFFQVTEIVSKKSIRIRQICSSTTETGFMSGEARPRPHEFLDGYGDMRKRVQPGNYVSLTSYSSAKRWDGKPKYTSWYA